MLRLLGLVLSISLADSLNPSTIAPGMYLAIGKQPRSGLVQFTLGVLAVNFLGGAIIALGPGEAVLALVPKPDHTARYIGETVAGAVMLIAAVLLWTRRHSLARRHQLPSPPSEGKSAFLLGVTIAAVELPTAFPYFAAIAAIVDSGFDPVRQLILIAVYNVAFVLPLILMIATLMIAPDRAEAIVTRARDFLERRWPALLAGLALVAGLFVIALGVTGLAKGTHGSLGRASGRLRRLISH
ncbi:MAG TPA: GAP family protein [Solirubrobacteraceae bacterium]|nr:GAP family protein [Solirubrobacteraceae bacterium]